MMFILAANQSCGFSEPPKLFENHECLKKWSYLRKGSFKGPKGQIGNEKYMLVMWKDPVGTLHRILQNQYFL